MRMAAWRRRRRHAENAMFSGHRLCSPVLRPWFQFWRHRLPCHGPATNQTAGVGHMVGAAYKIGVVGLARGIISSNVQNRKLIDNKIFPLHLQARMKLSRTPVCASPATSTVWQSPFSSTRILCCAQSSVSYGNTCHKMTPPTTSSTYSAW